MAALQVTSLVPLCRFGFLRHPKSSKVQTQRLDSSISVPVEHVWQIEWQSRAQKCWFISRSRTSHFVSEYRSASFLVSVSWVARLHALSKFQNELSVSTHVKSLKKVGAGLAHLQNACVARRRDGSTKLQEKIHWKRDVQSVIRAAFEAVTSAVPLNA